MEAKTSTRPPASKRTFEAPRTRTFQQIMDDLRRPVPERLVSTKTVPGKNGGRGYSASYIHHADLRDLLDLYAPGWESDVTLFEAGGKVFVRLRLTIHGSDFSATRTGLGNEDEDVSGYGDPSSNAHAQALRRAAMEFGLGRDLWRKG